MIEECPANPMLIAAARDDLCLDYANTLSWRGSPAPVEQLRAPADLLQWLAENAGYAAELMPGLGSWTCDEPTEAAELFADAIALREVIFRIFAALVAGAPVGDQDLGALNRALEETPWRDRIAGLEGGCAWWIGPALISAPALLAPVLWSAGDLMVKGSHERLRQCANEKCLWLFLEASRGGNRRWCDMASCGNRAKARRHYQKIRQG